MNRKEFCDYFGIPYRTVTEWERGTRKMPDYVFRLLAYRIKWVILQTMERQKRMKNKIIEVQNISVSILKEELDDYICITDIAKAKSGELRSADVIKTGCEIEIR